MNKIVPNLWFNNCAVKVGLNFPVLVGLDFPVSDHYSKPTAPTRSRSFMR